MPKKHNRARKDKVMTPEHSQWRKFIELLTGSEGCDYQPVPVTHDNPAGVSFRCLGGKDQSLASSVLIRFFPNVDVKLSREYWDQHGGFCDCEILWNVDPAAVASLEMPLNTNRALMLSAVIDTARVRRHADDSCGQSAGRMARARATARLPRGRGASLSG